MNTFHLVAVVMGVLACTARAEAPVDPAKSIPWSCKNVPALRPGTVRSLAGEREVAAHGVEVRLRRSHKHGVDGDSLGIWWLNFNRGAKSASVAVLGEEARGEGATLGVTWRLEGAVDAERLEVWPEEHAPLDADAAMACAEKAAASVGARAEQGISLTESHGVYVITFGGKPATRVVVGRYSRRAVILPAQP